MAYVLKPNEGLHFEAAGYHCAIGFVETGIGFQEMIVGVGPSGSMEFDAPEIVWTGDASSIANIGKFLMDRLPEVNAALQRQLHPLFAPVHANDPPTLVNLNTAMFEYFKEVVQPNGTPEIDFKPYP